MRRAVYWAGWNWRKLPCLILQGLSVSVVQNREWLCVRDLVYAISCLCKGSSSCPTVNEVRTKSEQTWSIISFLAALVDCPCERMEQKCLGIVDILPGQQIYHVNMVANYDWRVMPLVETHAGIRRV